MKNWIWDFDGTLFDSYPRMTRALLDALAEQGAHPPWEEALVQIKISVRAAIRHYAQRHGLDAERAMERYHWFEHHQTVPLAPYPGMRALCERHVAQGGAHYLYTHRNQTAMDALKAHGMERFFSDAITADDPFPHKPAPDALLHLIQKHRLAPSENVMIGDRDIDLLAAQNAGIAGCLFDPDHFFDAFDTPLRSDSVEGLARLLLADPGQAIR